MIGWLRRRLKGEAVSKAWLKDHARRGDRIEFHGVNIAWPVKKLLNESSLWNKSRQERKRA